MGKRAVDSTCPLSIVEGLDGGFVVAVGTAG